MTVPLELLNGIARHKNRRVKGWFGSRKGILTCYLCDRAIPRKIPGDRLGREYDLGSALSLHRMTHDREIPAAVVKAWESDPAVQAARMAGAHAIAVEIALDAGSIASAWEIVR